MLRFISADSE
jgi:hypothetical protein